MTGAKVKVRDWMTAAPIRVRPHTSMADARGMMQRHEVRRLLVVSDDQRLVGIITWGDLMEAWPSRFSPLQPFEVRELVDHVLVDELMATDVQSIEPDATAAEAANLLFENNIGALPVVEDGRVVGILTYTDLLQGLVRLLSGRE
jgi:acetoin utilization protein AcuB